jgi:hypothetical protein
MCGNDYKILLAREEKKKLVKTCPSTTMSKKYTKVTGLEVRLGLGGAIPSTGCLNSDRFRHGEVNIF